MRRKILSLFLCFLLTSSACFAKPGEIVKDIDKHLYRISGVGEDRDEITIGDEKNPASFKPKINISKWKDKDGKAENTLSIRFDGIDRNPVLEQGRVKAANEDFEFYCYQTDDNHIKFGVNFLRKPSTNKITFYLEGWEDFDFFYQRPLTPDEIAAGNECPEDVIGSYAIYHKSKKHNGYRTGKFGHFYRPKFTDAAGKSVWGDLHIENGVYTVTIPQDFLDNAVYPVKSNDTFGDTSLGSKASAAANWGTGYIWGFQPGYSFVLTRQGDSISIGAKTLTVNANLCMALYTVSGSNWTLFTNGSTGNVLVNSSTMQYWTAAFSTLPTLTSNTYYFAAQEDTASVLLAYDDSTNPNGQYRDGVKTYGSWGNFSSPTAWNTPWLFSIYCTYSALPSGVTIRPQVIMTNG